MSVTILEAPEEMAITLTYAKQQSRILEDWEDDLIIKHIKAATLYFENYVGRALIEQKLQLCFDQFPCSDFFLLQRGCPLVDVESVKFYDRDNVLQTLDTDLYSYSVGTIPGKVFRLGDTWGDSDIHPTRPAAVEVIYTAGYGETSEDVPEDIQLAVAMLVADSFSNRGNNEIAPGLVMIQPTYGTLNLMNRFKVNYYLQETQNR